ncbi:tripartite tricarboxylate transporter TctB family protein [Caldinitratiruptor microaerophilus]|uniref:DUF1468 domain-containing protein n=1 Tax=Caldinitratiruptor microaerophilus TaxID=671077 RepID=A0AA35G5J7_9FIRM|nr:tripartite tricarboxylate transporter TctB family protein [Caldinitratiruptor microaerophilus]BDG59536.1 hypothetical protein caldi_06260 [Caldinitratiruptor microaerophilus]
MRRTKALFALLTVLALVTAGEGWRLISRYGSQLGGRQAGGYLVLLGAALMILTLLGRHRGEFAGDPGPATGGGPAGGARRVTVCLVILAGYVFLTPRLGYLVSTVLFFLTYLRVLGNYRWAAAIALSALFGVGSAVVFAQAGMVLPRGMIAWP